MAVDPTLRYVYVFLRYRQQSAQLIGPAALPCPATYATSTSRMDTRDLPTTEVVIRNGQPIWRVCGAGMCIEDSSGTRAMVAFRALCASRGIDPSCDGPELPCRGPSEVDEPGV